MPGWVKGIFIALGVIVLVALAAPWWLGRAARPLAAKYGATYERYETRGYGGFSLHNVRFSRGATEVTAARIDGTTPVVWGWNYLRGAPPGWTATDWTVRVRPGGNPPPGEQPAARAVRGMASLHERLEQVVAALRKFLPSLEAKNGLVVVRQREIRIPSATFADARLSTRDLQYEAFRGDVAIAYADGKFTGELNAPATEAQARVEWARNEVTASGDFWQQPWTASATFPDEGWLPGKAVVQAKGFDIPADRVRLGTNYTRVAGDIDLRWDGDGFAARVIARASPREGGKIPPLEAHAEADGDLSEVRLTRLDVESPFARVKLSGPVAFGFNGELRSEAAALQVSGDLAQFPWFEAKGSVQGRVTIAGSGPDTKGEFALNATGVEFEDVEGRQVRVRGSWSIPEISVTEAHVELDEHTTLRGRGAWNWRSRELAGVSVTGRVDPKTLRRWIPPGMTWEQADLDARASGPVTAPRHEGSVRGVGLALKALHPTTFNAQWRGDGLKVDEITVAANSGEARVNGVAAIDRESLTIQRLDLTRSDGESLQLQAPARVTWKPSLALARLGLAGKERRLSVTLPSAGTGAVEIAAANFDDQWVRDWTPLPGPRWSLGRLDLRGRQEGGAFAFDVAGEAVVKIRNEDVRVQLQGAGGERGLRITQLAVGQDGQNLTQATGELPIVVSLQPAPSFTVQRDGPLAVKAEVTSRSALWGLVSEFSGIALAGATASADVGGSLARPAGTLRIGGATLDAAEGRLKGKLPKITDLSLVARADTDALRLESFAAKVAGQPVRATATLPVPAGGWEQLRQDPKALDWGRLEARLLTENVELAELARTISALPVTKGTLNASLGVADGHLSGDLNFFNAASRPIPGMGVLQNVHANVRLEDRDLKIAAFRGELGGEPVDLRGTANFNDIAKPRLDLTLAGKNLPLVRRPGLLVRTNLDLRAKTDNAGVTSIKGTVELRDSLVLADLAAILPGGPRGVGRQPPYFSVPQKPFSEWPLAVEVRGSRAVRVRTAVFNGVASANFDLTGTLGEPRAIGQLSVDEGRVLFPFATFEVQNGFVRISQADPHRLQLNVNAMARRHGYELRLEAGGTVSSPVVTLSSNPPLEAAEVLMMVTTGQPPAEDTAALTNQQRLTQLGAYVGKGILQNFGVGDGEARLEISSGEDVSRRGRETYQLEYRLNKKWALTGEYDEFDEYNAGVKWRVYEQSGKDDKPREDDEKR
jgi:translocation and assembly module TamB